MQEFTNSLLQWLSLPEYGLSTVFVMSVLAATLIPLTPTPFMVGLIKLNPELFWPAIFIAAIGNTLGGAINWWIGYGAKNLHEKITHKNTHGKVMGWLQKFGPKACIMCWLPVIGDPISIAAGWLRFSFWPCVAFMFMGRLGRFLVIAFIVSWMWPGALEF